MSAFKDLLGSINAAFQIGLGTGEKTLRFFNGFAGDLAWNPTAARKLSLPDKTGTVAITEDFVKPFAERIPSTNITTTTLLGNLTYSPVNATDVIVYVNGQGFTTSDNTPAISINDRAITWIPSAAFNLEPDDEIIARYFITGNFTNTNYQYPQRYKIPWVQLPLINSWGFLTGDFEDGAYRKHLDGTVETKGIISKLTGAADDQIFAALPIACAPLKNVIIPARSYNSTTDKNLHGAVFVKPPTTGTTTSSSNFKPSANLTYSPGRQGAEDVTNAYWFSVGGTWSSGQETALFFGDSNTIGDFIVPLDYTKRWSYLLCQAEGFREDNVSISGTTLQNTATTLPNNGRDRVLTDVVNRFPDRVYVMYGTNDIRRNDVNYTVANFKNDLIEVIDIILGSKLPADRIVLATPPYANPANYTGTVGWDAATNTRYNAFVQAIREVAIAKQVKFSDVYNYMKNNGGNSLLESDGVHANVSGHAMISSLMRNAQTINQ